METLKYSRLCFVFALLLGLLVAWSSATPQMISGEQISGAACGCSGAPPATCAALPGKECNETCYKCDTSGDDECTTKASTCTCADPDDDCVNVLWNQAYN